MIRQYNESDIGEVMRIWLDANIQAHHFISSDYWRSNCGIVKEMFPHAEIYVHENDCAKQIDGFIGLNDNYIEGIFVRKSMQSKGIGKQLLNYAKEVKPTLRLNVYQKNARAIKFYMREKFYIQSENIDDNTGEKEFVMVWNRKSLATSEFAELNNSTNCMIIDAVI